LAYKIDKRKEETMPRKRYTPEQIINSLREAEVLISQGSTAKEASRHLSNIRADLLQVEKRIWRDEDKPGQEIKGARKGKFPS
jgi:hypothetical protein